MRVAIVHYWLLNRHGGEAVLEALAPHEDRLGGVFYLEPREEELARAIDRFEKVEAQIWPRELQGSVVRFAEADFMEKMGHALGPAATSHPSLATRPPSCAAES